MSPERCAGARSRTEAPRWPGQGGHRGPGARRADGRGDASGRRCCPGRGDHLAPVRPPGRLHSSAGHLSSAIVTAFRKISLMLERAREAGRVHHGPRMRARRACARGRPRGLLHGRGRRLVPRVRVRAPETRPRPGRAPAPAPCGPRRDTAWTHTRTCAVTSGPACCVLVRWQVCRCSFASQEAGAWPVYGPSCGPTVFRETTACKVVRRPVASSGTHCLFSQSEVFRLIVSDADLAPCVCN